MQMNITSNSGSQSNMILCVKILTILVILANAFGMFFPCLNSMFSPYYGSIAKHIALTNNWTDLVFNGHDWLDKPHLPFWLTAVSFKVFGINSFAYILPGFIFHLIGVYYTYKLAKFWYNAEVALLAALFTASTLHLMLSSIDVRAEAFLIGEIIPACYYWLKYDKDFKLKYLLLGAIFTACAMMTKGLFTLITITSGMMVLWIYQKKWSNFVSLKWIAALILSFIFIAPELAALYIQFNLHPEKIVFGQTHVSGISWFFFGSQFGRFFNTGHIAVNHTQDMHYLFFVYTFFWAYLPWWPMFFAAIWQLIRGRKNAASVFLFSSFFITFFIFSITKFQIDHYTNIIFPFASIICANWFWNSIVNYETNHKPILLQSNRLFSIIAWSEIGIAVLLLSLTIVLSLLVLSGIPVIAMLILEAAAGALFFKLGCNLTMTSSSRIMGCLTDIPRALLVIIYPTLAISITFIFVMLVNGIGYAKYDAGYQIAQYLNQQNNIQVVGYLIDLNSLSFHSNNQFTLIDNSLKQQIVPTGVIPAQAGIQYIIKDTHQAVYCVTTPENQAAVLQAFPGSTVANTISGTSIETYMRNVIHPELLEAKLNHYVIIAIPSPRT